MSTTRAVLSGALLAGALLCPAAGVAGLALAPGDKVPELRGQTPRRERVVLDFTRSRYTLLNFWATWCEPCRAEIPTLEKLHRDHPGDLQVVGVVRDSASDEVVQAFIDALDVTYTNVRPQARYEKLWRGASSLPTSFLIGQDGRLVRRYVGATAEQTAALVYDVEAVLAGRPLGPFVVPEPGSAVTHADKPKPPARGSEGDPR